MAREDKLRAIADYIAGMTDRYAMKEHRRLFAVGRFIETGFLHARCCLRTARRVGSAESRLASPHGQVEHHGAASRGGGWAVVFVEAARVAIHACEPPRRSIARRTSVRRIATGVAPTGQAERRGAIRLRGRLRGLGGRPAGVFVACRSAKLLNPASFGGYSFSTAANRTVVSKMVHEARKVALRPVESLFLHQIGADYKAGARAPGFLCAFGLSATAFRPISSDPEHVILSVV